jgi:hypothetical protein
MSESLFAHSVKSHVRRDFTIGGVKVFGYLINAGGKLDGL